MSWADNFPVYLANLSPVYIFSILISVVALLASIFYQRTQKSFVENKSLADKLDDSDEAEDISEDLPSTPLLTPGQFGGIVGKIKAAKQKAILKKLKGDEYSDETDELEKRTEVEQLEAIWELLRQEEDKYHVSSKKEMQEQLLLYRS